jgi:mRNA interferase MazF
VVIRRGEIWWADLADPDGSGPGYRRPVLILQSDGFNRGNIRTVIIAVITSNEKLAELPGNVLLSTKASRLRRESVVNVSQLFTIDKDLLLEKVGMLREQYVAQVDLGLRLVLGLGFG